MKKVIFLFAIVLMTATAVYTVNNYTKSTSNIKNSPASSENQNTSKNNNTASNTNRTDGSLIQISPNYNIKVKTADFKLKDLNGREFSLSELKGKRVFLNFWATWCPPCRAEMPEIEQLYQETKNSDLVIIAVEIGGPLDTVKAFISQNKYNFKVLLDSDKSVAEQYGISSIPTSFFIDKDGYIAAKNTGAMDYSQMQEYIKSLDK